MNRSLQTGELFYDYKRQIDEKYCPEGDKEIESGGTKGCGFCSERFKDANLRNGGSCLLCNGRTGNGALTSHRVKSLSLILRQKGWKQE